MVKFSLNKLLNKKQFLQKKNVVKFQRYSPEVVSRELTLGIHFSSFHITQGRPDIRL